MCVLLKYHYFRLGRGLKTLEDLLKRALNGNPVNESEIPLPVAVKQTPSDPAHSTALTPRPEGRYLS